MDQRKIKIFLITITVILVGVVLGTTYSITRREKSKTQLSKQNQDLDKNSEQGSIEKYLPSSDSSSEETASGGAASIGENNTNQQESITQFLPTPTKEDAVLQEKYYNSRGEFIGDSSRIVNSANEGSGLSDNEVGSSGNSTGESSSEQASKKTNDSSTGAYIPNTAPYLP